MGDAIRAFAGVTKSAQLLGFDSVSIGGPIYGLGKLAGSAAVRGNDLRNRQNIDRFKSNAAPHFFLAGDVDRASRHRIGGRGILFAAAGSSHGPTRGARTDPQGGR